MFANNLHILAQRNSFSNYLKHAEKFLKAKALRLKLLEMFHSVP